jgi:CPA2 family monovalent cation:H+ antiporter-2
MSVSHHAPLITTIVMGFVLAFSFGLVAQRLRISPIVGYLLAGILMGPFTPGYVGDQDVATQLAEIGVILLMFGVGLHFSLDDLLSVRGIAIPGAVTQITVATLLGIGLATLMDWNIGAGLVFGLALSTASTVVLLRALQERRLLETERGRIAVGWLIVEDIAMVLTLVLLPPIANPLKGSGGAEGLHALALPLLITLGKVAAFIAFMLIVGRRIIPAMLHYVAHTGSRELFRLAVLSTALGVAAGAAALFDVSFALGAFFAGMVLSESELSQRAANETLPLRDAFAVLFFVSVGMLVDPMIVVQQPLQLLATLFIIMIGKSIAAFGIVRLFGYPTLTAATVSASLAQIGEFSFILAGLGVSLQLLPEAGRDLVLAGAIISIVLNPLCFAALDRFTQRTVKQPAAASGPPESKPGREPLSPTMLIDHVVLVGHGRVGSYIRARLKESGVPCLVIEEDADIASRLRQAGGEVLTGNAADPEVIAACNLSAARCLMVAVPDAFEGGQVVQQARAVSADLPILARAHSDEEVEHLKKHGASLVVMGEHEIAKTMVASLPKVASASDGSKISPSA